MKSIRRVINWLGPARAQIIFFLLAITGFASLILNAVNAQGKPQDWVPVVQSLLAIVFLVGAALVFLSRLSPDERKQAAIVIVPALIALSLGLLFPSLLPFFVPVVLGWLVIVFIAMRGRVRREYQDAIRHMRKNEYDEAIKVMSDLIKAEPDDADHRRFRAELFRLAGKVKRARADYEKVIELQPESGVGYNGLAEVYLQDGEYEQALPYARQALEREPDHWVAPYNLGMIEDRLQQWPSALDHLNQALTVGVPDSRHRLLIHLWLARAYYQQGKTAEAEAEIAQMKHERTGLQEWQTIFESQEAAVLRDVMLGDVQLAGQLVSDGASLDVLKAGQS